MKAQPMLDTAWHQASGLRWQGRQEPLRVLPVLASAEPVDAQALWTACSLLQQQGYPVVVLDGSEKETPATPGLQDLLKAGLDQGLSPLPVNRDAVHELATLPAARGMLQLVHQASQLGQRPLHLLYRHLRHHALVVLWAPAPLLNPLIVGCSQPPLLLVPERPSQLLPSYRLLKQVLLETGMMPRLLALRAHSAGFEPALRALTNCARQHLHIEPLCQQLDPQQARQLQRWAFQCLEQAECLQPQNQIDLSAPAGHRSVDPAWSH